MKIAASFTSVLPILANLGQQVVTATALLTELPSGSTDRRYVSEWLAESLAATYRIERQLAAVDVPRESPDGRRPRHNGGEFVACESIAEPCSEVD